MAAAQHFLTCSPLCNATRVVRTPTGLTSCSNLCGQVARKWLTPEEVELADVERQMEEQLVAQHRLVDRVIAQRSEPDGSLRYLAKVGSLGGSQHTCGMASTPSVCQRCHGPSAAGPAPCMLCGWWLARA